MQPDFLDLGYFIFRPFELLMEYVVRLRTKFSWQARQGSTAAAMAGDVEPPKEKPRPPSGGNRQHHRNQNYFRYWWLKLNSVMNVRKS